MGLRDTITNWIRQFRRSQGDADAENAPTTASEATRRPASVSDTVRRFQVESGRRAEVTDARKMYREDTRVEGILSTLARDAVKGGFQVKVTEGVDPELAQEVASELVKRLKLFSILDDWFRLTLRDGDTFLECVANADREIVDVSRKPTLGMHRNSNRQDQFDDPARAYWHSDRAWDTEPPGDAIWFADWQIIHARWKHDEGERYGHPLLSSARTAYKRMTEGELDVALRRKTRAGMKYVHQFPPGTDQTAIEQYMERNKAALDDPFAAVMDFFGTAEVKTVSGDAEIGKIEDIVHHIRTFWAGQPVPMSLIGYGQDLNRDVLGEQKEQYDEALQGVREWVEDSLVKPLLELQWLLAGIWPAGMTYEIVWASKKVITAEGVQQAADAMAKLKSTGLLPDEELIKVLVELLPMLDVDAIMAFLKTQAENEVDSLAQAIAARSGAGRRQDQTPEEEEPPDEATERRRHVHVRAIVA